MAPGVPAEADLNTSERPTDEALVERAQGRDLAAFEELVERHEGRLYRVALRLLRNESDAREVLQEALLSAWQKLDGFAGRARFGTWLHRVVVNEALMLMRSRRRRQAVSIEELEPGAFDQAVEDGGGTAGSDWSKRPDEQLQSAEVKRHIEAAVDSLSESLRVVFVLRDLEELSTEETAELLGVTVPTVKTRLHRARLALRRAISDYFERN